MKKLFLGAFLFLCACDRVLVREHHDPALHLKKEDYKQLTDPKPVVVPTPSPVQTLEPPLPSYFKERVSLEINESTPLKEVFIELGKQVKANIMVDAKINKGGMLYSVKSKPFMEVIETLCESAQLRYKVQKDILIIEKDDPFLKTYDLQFITGSRQMQNRISVMTDVFTSIEGSQTVTDNGSDSVLSHKSQIDFWSELETNLKMLLESSEKESRYTFHKQGGLVSILAKESTHKKISNYLDQLKSATSSQVLIEAKIVEVSLNEDFKTGINWNLLKGNLALSAPFGSLSTPGRFNPQASPLKDVFSFAIKGKDLSTVANLLNRFGTVRTLSNPRLTVLNNQPAMLKVATNQVFFKLQTERLMASNGKPDVENTISTIQTVPIGLVLVVQPTIDRKTGDITLSLRPTLSRVIETRNDPAVALKASAAGQAIESPVPVIQVREFDSVMKVSSGQVAVMGGLMEERSNNATSGVPGAEDIPLLNVFFKSAEDERSLTELVLFVRAWRIEDGVVLSADEELYKGFVADPRPLTFQH